MKKSILSLMIGSAVALTSCSKSDQMPTATQEGYQPMTFQVEAPATRTAVTDLTRYIVEVYEGNNLDNPPVRVESATGTLTVILKKSTSYTFLFWADKGKAKTESVTSSGYWNTDNLQAVTVTETEKNKVGEEAYCNSLSFSSGDFQNNKDVELKNATAQVNFIESIGLETGDNTLTVTYSAGSTLNIGKDVISEVSGAVTHTFTGIAQASANAIIATDYVLAKKGGQSMLGIKMKFNSEAEKELTNVPFQQSFKTNIKGEYSSSASFTFTVTADDEWGTRDNDKDLP